jgi:hypothetical protein
MPTPPNWQLFCKVLLVVSCLHWASSHDDSRPYQLLVDGLAHEAGFQCIQESLGC